MLSLPTSRRHTAPPPTMLRRGLSVDIFKADDGAPPAPPPSVAVDVPLPATLARVLSGMDKLGQSLEPDVALRIYKSDGSGALTRVLSSAPGDAAARAAAAAEAAAAVAAVLAGGAARGSSSLADRLLASGVAESAVLVVTPRRRATCDGGGGGVVRQPAARATATYTTRESGDPGTPSHRIHVVDADAGADVSPWTDVPLFCTADDDDGDVVSPSPPLLAHFVCEVGRGGRAKYEVDTKDAARKHPLKQDTKNGALRFYPGPLPFNYGMLPRTLEDPAAGWAGAAAAADPLLAAAKGDGDPVDVVELSAATLAPGSVTPVKLVAALAMIDGGELDWKLLALDAASPVAGGVFDAASFDAALPGEIDRVVSFFSTYKGPGAVQWGLGGKPVGAAETVGIVADACAAFREAGQE